MLKLHFAPNSRAGRIVWLLEELGLPYDINKMAFHPKDLKSDEHRARHPLGRVPVLEILRTTASVRDCITNPEKTVRIADLIRKAKYAGAATELASLQEGIVAVKGEPVEIPFADGRLSLLLPRDFAYEHVDQRTGHPGQKRAEEDR